jgi:hypothetical protein
MSMASLASGYFLFFPVQYGWKTKQTFYFGVNWTLIRLVICKNISILHVRARAHTHTHTHSLSLTYTHTHKHTYSYI